MSYLHFEQAGDLFLKCFNDGFKDDLQNDLDEIDKQNLEAQIEQFENIFMAWKLRFASKPAGEVEEVTEMGHILCIVILAMDKEGSGKCM